MQRIWPALALWLLLSGAWFPLAAQPEPPASDTPAAQRQMPPIFRRFGQQVAPEAWLSTLEVPVYARPQTEPDAKIVNNTGVNLVVAFRPRNRIYFSRGYDFAQTVWEPKDGSVERIEVTTFDISEMLNFNLGRVAVLTLGLGLGLMDGTIKEEKGSQINRLEPFVPIQFGLGLPLGSSLFLGLKLSHHFFLGPGPVVHLTRGLIGLGYYF